MSLPLPRPRSVGIVGLGDQGTPIALRVLGAGWPLAFHARRPEVRRRFEAEGAKPLSPADLGAASDVVLVVVGDEHDVRAAVVESGLLAAMRSGAILVVHSSIPPEAILRLGAEADAYGVHLLDAPVSGGRVRSYAGDLTILVGGDEDILESSRPIMSAYGSAIVRIGDLGSGQLIKSLNNYFYAAHLATAAKAVELIRGLGLDVEIAAQVLPGCSGSSTAFAIQAARGFAPTCHDKGAMRAGELLEEVVDSLRAAAARAEVELGLVDRLVDTGLESLRTASSSQGAPA